MTIARDRLPQARKKGNARISWFSTRLDGLVCLHAFLSGRRHKPRVSRKSAWPFPGSPHLFRHAPSKAGEPRVIMVGGIGPKGMHEDVDVREDHCSFMTSSKSLDRFRSIPGRTPPVALETGKSTRPRRPDFGLATTSFRASSISEVKVRPSSAARFWRA